MDQPQLGWYLDRNGEPRLRFRCAAPYEDKCKGTHSIACSLEWLLLQPLPITDKLFQTMRHLHGGLERTWDHYRARYAYAGKDATSRLKRLGGARPQQLRGEAALLIDWFRVMLRQGWLGSWKMQNPNTPQVVTAPLKKLQKIADVRRARGLDVPYGKRWERLKERLKKNRKKPYTHGPPERRRPSSPRSNRRLRTLRIRRSATGRRSGYRRRISAARRQSTRRHESRPASSAWAAFVVHRLLRDKEASSRLDRGADRVAKRRSRSPASRTAHLTREFV